MGLALEEHWPAPLEGLVVTRPGHALPLRQLTVLEAGHPLPDDRSQEAGARLMGAAAGRAPEDLVITLFSGGASSLLSLPAPGVTLQEKQQITRQLMEEGAPISEINCVRRHLSALKGGRLARACRPARVETFLISDVPGDDPADIGSGPTVGDPSTSAQALAILEKYKNLPIPAAVRRHLASPASETLEPDDPALDGTRATLVATAHDALAAAGRMAERAGLECVILGAALEGDSAALGQAHATLARAVAAGDRPVRPPCLLLSGGETTVTWRAGGSGGPRGEYLLSLALALGGHPGVHALACDTDGIDGTGVAAGAVIHPDTLIRARSCGLDPAAALEAHDSHSLFGRLDALVLTGPTLTNVGDFRALLILPAATRGV
jgi:hydroxypyruvate reductase